MAAPLGSNHEEFFFALQLIFYDLIFYQISGDHTLLGWKCAGLLSDDWGDPWWSFCWPEQWILSSSWSVCMLPTKSRPSSSSRYRYSNVLIKNFCTRWWHLWLFIAWQVNFNGFRIQMSILNLILCSIKDNLSQSWQTLAIFIKNRDGHLTTFLILINIREVYLQPWKKDTNPYTISTVEIG